MIAPRYAPALYVLVAIALVPTLIHSYSGNVERDGLSTSRIPATLAGYYSTPTRRSKNWAKAQFDSDDWIERNYTRETDEVRLTVIRSYDLKALYHHPELAVAYGTHFGGTFDGKAVFRAAAAPDIPIHVLPHAPGANAVALYVLHYDDEFTEDPLWFQVRSAATLLVSRRKQMTLFFANDLAAPVGRAVEDLPAIALLRAAIEAFTASS